MVSRGGYAKRTLAIIAVLGAAGCSSMSLLNPYVGGDITSPLAADRGETAIEYYGELPRQYARASALQTDYYDAVGHQALLRNGIALTVIPLTAGALFQNTTHAGSDLSPAVAAITSASLGIGSFMQSTPRQRVYLSGVNAIACATLKSQAYLFTQDGHDDLITHRDTLLRSVGRLQTLIDRAPNDTALSRELAAARGALARGQLAAADLAELLSQIEGAPLALHTDLTFIRVSVAQQITRTEPDLDALSSLLTRMRTTDVPSAGTPPPEPTDEGAHDAPGAATVTAAGLGRETGILNGEVMFVRSVIDGRRRVRNDAMASSVCATSIASGSTFHVEPGESTITLTPCAPFDFVVTGSMLTANVGYSLAGANTADLEVEVVRAQGSVTFRVTAKDAAKPGARVLTITDRNGEDTYSTSLVVPPS